MFSLYTYGMGSWNWDECFSTWHHLVSSTALQCPTVSVWLGIHRRNKRLKTRLGVWNKSSCSRSTWNLKISFPSECNRGLLFLNTIFLFIKEEALSPRPYLLITSMYIFRFLFINKAQGRMPQWESMCVWALHFCSWWWLTESDNHVKVIGSQQLKWILKTQKLQN